MVGSKNVHCVQVSEDRFRETVIQMACLLSVKGKTYRGYGEQANLTHRYVVRPPCYLLGKSLTHNIYHPGIA